MEKYLAQRGQDECVDISERVNDIDYMQEKDDDDFDEDLMNMYHDFQEEVGDEISKPIWDE